MTDDIRPIEKVIEEKIATGDVTKKSRLYFVLRSVALYMGAVIILCVSVYLMSLVLFISQAQGSWLLTGFGWDGFKELFISLPWLIIGLVLLLVVVMEILSRQFAFVYRRPLLLSLVGFILLIIAAGTGIASTTLHRTLYNSARNNHLPMAGGLYRGLRGMRPHNAYFGVVNSQQGPVWQVTLKDDDDVDVMINDRTRFPFGDQVVPRDHILIIGVRSDGRIYAFGIRKIGPEMEPEF